MMNESRHPLSLKGGETCFLIVFQFHAIWRQILEYRFWAISSRELSVYFFHFLQL